MRTHSIRLKAPWLVTHCGTTTPHPETGQPHSAGRDLVEQVRQLLSETAGSQCIWAVRRFHRPTGLSPNSELCLAVQSSLQPDLVSWGPIAPGAPGASQHEQLTRSQLEGNRAEYRLPGELPLRSELRLQWSQLELRSAPSELTVELVIKEPA